MGRLPSPTQHPTLRTGKWANQATDALTTLQQVMPEAITAGTTAVDPEALAILVPVSATAISVKGISDQGPIQTSDRAPMWAPPAVGNMVGMDEVSELTEQVQHAVFVRSPRRSGLTRVLTGMGATVLAGHGRGLSVTGMDACSIASAAAAHYIPILELTPKLQPGAKSSS